MTHRFVRIKYEFRYSEYPEHGPRGTSCHSGVSSSMRRTVPLTSPCGPHWLSGSHSEMCADRQMLY